jgi:60 kDa SS-A/Ro ribonucleoprotein
MRGKGEWTFVPGTVSALNRAIELSFENVLPTNKRIYLALDLSGSLGVGEVGGIPGLTPRAASAALAMMTMRSEKGVIILGFSGGMSNLSIRPEMSLEQVIAATNGLPFDRTDSAQPDIGCDR